MSRFYSTENNGEQKEAPQEGQEGGENAESEDPLRKELEEKKKEIVELKVHPTAPSQRSNANKLG